MCDYNFCSCTNVDKSAQSSSGGILITTLRSSEIIIVYYLNVMEKCTVAQVELFANFHVYYPLEKRVIPDNKNKMRSQVISSCEQRC